MFGGNIITAKVFIKKDYAIKNVYDWFGKNATLKIEDDKLYAYIRTDEKAFLYWALQYCEDYKVIEPEYLKKQMIDHAKEMLKDYEG
jgi:predicted DNA-binding transcriptional regulator YafY